MSLSALDAKVGTIVDHMEEHHEDGRRTVRPIIRRGIIVKVDGENSDSVSNIMVKFSVDGQPEKVSGGELVRVYPSTSRVAREAYRRIMGLPRHVGAEFQAKKAPVRARIQDAMALTAKPGQGIVRDEEQEAEEIGGMPMEDTGA